jgi:hypothetical protein
MADDLVNIEIDGVPVKARKGEMLIRVPSPCRRVPRPSWRA